MNSTRSKPFLATTAIEEFWDKKREIIFLGEWCKLFSRKDEWRRLAYYEAPYVWRDTDIMLRGILYCHSVYENTLGQLTNILNEYHGICKDILYYRIILGNWLYQFIQQLYDKFQTLSAVLEKYDNIDTWVLAEEQYYIPLDYDDFCQKRRKDKYALQIYSQILNSLKHKFQTKKLSNPLGQKLYYQINTNKNLVFLRFVANITKLIGKVKKENITITAPYFNYNIIRNYLRLFLKSRSRFIFDEMRYKVSMKFSIDYDFRRKTMMLGNNLFEIVLSKVLIFNIPILYLEGFNQFRDAVLNLPINRSNAFLTATAYNANSIFKYFVAENYDTIYILGLQHGGGYGIDLICPPEEFEKSISNRFYTSGWQKDEKTIPLSIPKFKKKMQLL